jgi:hypothetical protein
VDKVGFVHIQPVLFADVLKNLPACRELLHKGKVEKLLYYTSQRDLKTLFDAFLGGDAEIF